MSTFSPELCNYGNSYTIGLLLWNLTDHYSEKTQKCKKLKSKKCIIQYSATSMKHPGTIVNLLNVFKIDETIV